MSEIRGQDDVERRELFMGVSHLEGGHSVDPVIGEWAI